VYTIVHLKALNQSLKKKIQCLESITACITDLHDESKTETYGGVDYAAAHVIQETHWQSVV
jgi:hypothetical protein